MMNFYELAKAQEDSIVSLRREFHSHPELSRQEFETAARIEKELDALGIEHRRVGETGVFASLRGKLPTERIVVLRADIDALPITDQKTEVSYCSQVDGVAHACGHDVHTAALLGAARLLADCRDSFGGEIRFVFQQAEEIGYGAKIFLEEGLLEGADRLFGLHTAVDLEVGQIGVKAGPNNAAVDHFTIAVKGKGAHVSVPQLGADALYIASQIEINLQGIVTRLTSPIDPVILGVGTLHAGEGYNVVAKQAVLEGTTRTFSLETRKLVNGKLDALAEQTAALYGGSASIVWDDFTSPLANDPVVCKEVGETVKALFGEESLLVDRPLSLGGDDFAELLFAVPGVYAYLGTANPALPDTLVSQHNGRFDVDERALPIGAALYASCAYRWLTEETKA